MTSEKVKSYMQENRKCLIKIIESLLFLGRQGLALRGGENYGCFLVAKFINIKFIPQIANSFIKRKKNTHRECPMNQIYVAC